MWFDFGIKGKNPVDAVTFFNKSHKPVEIKVEELTDLLPQNFQKIYVRVYAKQPEQRHLIEQCVKKFFS